MPHDHDPDHWVNRPATIFAAGAAAVLLIGVLIFAVMRTAGDSSLPPDTFVPPSSSTPSSTYTTSSTTTTTYTTPAPQTSDQNLPSAAPSASGTSEPSTSTTADTPDSGTVTETATLLPPPS